MSNYKVKVNNELESKEVQELFFELGYEWKDIKDNYRSIGKFDHLTAFKESMSICQGFGFVEHKELTIQQLKDLVVLKRNSIDDATHKCETRYQKKGYLTSDNVEYFWNYMDKCWHISSNSFESEKLKPISPLKEYLVPQGNGKYECIKTDIREAKESHAKNWIEVPKGCDYLVSVSGVNSFIEESMIHKVKSNKSFERVLWQRHTQPEELPFLDDEPKLKSDEKYDLDYISKVSANGENLDNLAKMNGFRNRFTGEDDKHYRKAMLQHIHSGRTQSLNDTYAEIEQVRQGALSIQVGGNHYKNLAIQPVEFAMQNNLDYCQANAIKYIVRHADKNGKEDLLKAKHYIDLMIQHYYTDK